jgi:RNA polymerase sigma factor (sigma-70 family)
MANGPLGVLLRQLGQFVKAPAPEPLTDGSLLERFVAQRDESAFAVLVERHGPMVLGVCRRVLHDWHEAEDVFQAAFLVLARRAGTLDRRGSVGPWLHTVALRLAWRAKTQADRWRRCSRKADDMDRATLDPEPAGRELRSVLDEELERLPAKYRAPLVLCYLEGMTVDETAAHLGWPRGTVGGRLARAKDLMRRRLTRRGVTLGAAGLGAAPAHQAPPAVPAALAASTVQAALVFAVGGVPTGTVATSGLLLAQGAIRTMMLHRLARTAAVLLLLGTTGAGVGVLGHQAFTQPPSHAPNTLRTDGPEQAAEAAPVRLDPNGDPLPPGARTRLGTVRFRHGQPVTAVAFTADGRILVSASLDGTLRLWDAATHQEIRRFDIFPQTASFGLSADGKTVAAPVPEGNDRTTIRVWDTATGREIHRVEPGTVVDHVLLAADGQSLVWGDARGVHLQHIKTGTAIQNFNTPKGLLLGLALSADGKTLAASDSGSSVRVWDAASGIEQHRIDSAADVPLHMALSPDGRTVASHADKEDVVRRWDVATGRERAPLTLKNAGLLTGLGIPDQQNFGDALAFSADGRCLATTVAQGSLWSVVIWETATGDRLKVAPVPTLGAGGALSAVALSSDGRTLATGGRDNLVRATRLIGSGIGGDLAGPHEGPVQAVAVTPDGKTLATACEQGGIYLWETAGGRFLTGLPESVGPGNRLAFSPDGKTLATFSQQDFRITLWDRGAGWDVPGGHDQRMLKGHRQRVGALGFATDGRTLTSWGLDRTFRQWDVATAQEVRRTVVPAEGVHDVAFAPDGQLAAGAAKGTGNDATIVYLWNPATGAEVRRWDLRGCVADALAFSPDGRMLAITGKGEAATTIRLLQIADGKETKQWIDPSHQRILAVAFSPDGKTLATGSERRLRLWDVATARQRAVYQGHQAPITSIAFAPDGKTVFTASADTTALAWDLSTLAAK